MSENKYANNDVIRALERCNFGKFENCEGCPGENIEYSSEEGGCCYILHQCALDLINRQRAEIAEYQKHIDQDIIYVHRVQAEAVKKFAEKLKKEQEFHVDECDRFVGFVAVSRIDKLVEEMTKGDQNGTVGSTQ